MITPVPPGTASVGGLHEIRARPSDLLAEVVLARCRVVPGPLVVPAAPVAFCFACVGTAGVVSDSLRDDDLIVPIYLAAGTLAGLGVLAWGDGLVYRVLRRWEAAKESVATDNSVR